MPDSSIVVGARTVAEGRSQGFISAGNTGAMLAAALLVVKRVSGVTRPAIVTTLPGLDGPVLLLDSGANADCRPEHLLEFGVLGSAYARTVLGIDGPRVGLLNIGEEESKGSELARAAHRLLTGLRLDFVGNVEGRDLPANTADVVVTDGFTGNVALKLLEGCASAFFARIKARGQQRDPGQDRAACCCSPRCAVCARPSTRRRWAAPTCSACVAWWSSATGTRRARRSPTRCGSAPRRCARGCCRRWRRSWSAMTDSR